MLSQIKKLFLVLCLPCLAIACTSSAEGNEQADSTVYATKKPALTAIQQSAADARNELQQSTDEKNRFYSTFPNLKHPCFPADTSFEISQAQLLMVMHEFIAKHATRLEPHVQDHLALSSVLSQDNYTVLHCRGDQVQAMKENAFPMTGTWILPKVLDRTDVVLVW